MFFDSVQIITCLDRQSKLEMFTLFSGCHIGGLMRSSNMAAYLAKLDCFLQSSPPVSSFKFHELR